ncbi:MAG: hypothetical protein M1820_007818 [Bogoriella megaspora]|nr:MAG: hypothetical protein M1820_007818 [Bogoriella megaspora]
MSELEGSEPENPLRPPPLNDRLQSSSALGTNITPEHSKKSPALQKRNRLLVLTKLNLSGNSASGNPIPWNQALQMRAIWGVKEVKLPKEQQIRSPSEDDITALIVFGRKQGTFQNCILRIPGEKYDNDNAIILLQDKRTATEGGDPMATYCYQTDFLPEDATEEPAAEMKKHMQMKIVILEGEDLPTFHFWQRKPPSVARVGQICRLEKQERDLQMQAVGELIGKAQQYGIVLDSSPALEKDRKDTAAQLVEGMIGLITRMGEDVVQHVRRILSDVGNRYPRFSMALGQLRVGQNSVQAGLATVAESPAASTMQGSSSRLFMPPGNRVSGETEAEEAQDSGDQWPPRTMSGGLPLEDSEIVNLAEDDIPTGVYASDFDDSLSNRPFDSISQVEVPTEMQAFNFLGSSFEIANELSQEEFPTSVGEMDFEGIESTENFGANQTGSDVHSRSQSRLAFTRRMIHEDADDDASQAEDFSFDEVTHNPRLQLERSPPRDRDDSFLTRNGSGSEEHEGDRSAQLRREEIRRGKKKLEVAQTSQSSDVTPSVERDKSGGIEDEGDGNRDDEEVLSDDSKARNSVGESKAGDQERNDDRVPADDELINVDPAPANMRQKTGKSRGRPAKIQTNNRASRDAQETRRTSEPSPNLKGPSRRKPTSYAGAGSAKNSVDAPPPEKKHKQNASKAKREKTTAAPKRKNEKKKQLAKERSPLAGVSGSQGTSLRNKGSLKRKSADNPEANFTDPQSPPSPNARKKRKTMSLSNSPRSSPSLRKNVGNAGLSASVQGRTRSGARYGVHSAVERI